MASSRGDWKSGQPPETESRDTIEARPQEAESQQKLQTHGSRAQFDSASDLVESEHEKSVRSSLSHWDPEPGFEHVDGDAGGGHGYNDTEVDIVAVPCIGASPVDTWARDPLGDGYFDVTTPAPRGKYQTIRELPGRTILSPTINRPLPKASPLWIRQGIRKEINTARVMLYRHRELTEGYTLSQAADDLLEQLSQMRAGLPKSRPIFFVCHSIGGLVAKLALVKASKIEELRPLVFDCHGMTFFGRYFDFLPGTNVNKSIQLHHIAAQATCQCLICARASNTYSTSRSRYQPLLPKSYDLDTDRCSESMISSPTSPVSFAYGHFTRRLTPSYPGSDRQF